MADQKNDLDHLFISYAWEDGALAEWLTRKLTAAGFRVWCDRFKLLGGESYPKDIDAAIKTQTFRVLALLSHHSIDKDNPRKERTLALNIGKERKTDFLIPLNVDGLKPTELDWMTNDLTYIAFHQSWADGLQQLLKKLDVINAPRPLVNGSQVAVETFLPIDVLKNTPEPLSSNCLKFQKIPVAIKRFRFNRELEKKERDTIGLRWSCYWVTPKTALAFQTPPAFGGDIRVEAAGAVSWPDFEQVDGISTTNIVSSLLYKSLRVRCAAKGLQLSADGRFFFPQGLLEKDKIIFVGYEGDKTWVLATGERSAWSPGKPSVKYRYHLSPEISVVRNFIDPFIAQLRVRLHLTGADGVPLAHRSALARRKKICKNWWNHDWLNRVLAIGHFLSDGGDTIVIGTAPSEQIVLGSRPVVFEAPMSIDEDFFAKPAELPLAQEVDEIDEGDMSEQEVTENV